MWRCPHCGTPQAETARCWVCRRSSTACGTCRNFRHSVAGTLGFCGLDRRRQPLVGDEIRACWEAWPDGAEATVIAPLTVQPANPLTTAERPIQFVEVGDRSSGDPVTAPAAMSAASTGAGAGAKVPPALHPGPPLPVDEPRWSLWGEPDR
jgi:hypothetical protein